ncbi:MAG: HDOD domain-containing protein, partial [Dehalococcoidia bacterium]
RAANSVASAPREPVRRTGDALVRLGVDDTRALILATLLEDGASNALGRSEIDVDELWRHTLAVGLLTEATCASDETLADLRGMAFTGGVLHDIGRLVLAAQQPRRYARVVRLAARGTPVIEAELSQFSLDHAAFGGGVALAWGLPEVIASAIAGHHEGGTPLARALQQAIAIARSLGIGDGVAPAPVPALDFASQQAAPLRLLGGPGVLMRRIEWFRAALGA